MKPKPDDSGPADQTVIERISADGIPYLSRDVPSNVKLQVVDYKNHSALKQTGAFETHHMYVSCQEVNERYLPFLDANPREPSQTPQVKNMQGTLGSQPEDFVKMNNGLTIICTNIEFDSKEQSVEIQFSENEGVCNGGHTYFAIQTYEGKLAKNASVRIEAIQLPQGLDEESRKEQIVKIARARNDNRGLGRSSEADFLGYYAPYKNGMRDDQLVSWHEGDADAYSEAISAQHFIRLLQSIDPTKYYHPIYSPGADRHKRLAISPGNVHAKWYDNMEDAKKGNQPIPLRHMIPMIDDMFMIRDHLSYSLKHDDWVGEIGGDRVKIKSTSLYKDFIAQRPNRNLKSINDTEGFDLSRTFETLLLGLFRSNVWRSRDASSDINMIGWFEEPLELWSTRRLSVMSQLAEYFQEVDSDPKQLIRKSAGYEKDLYGFAFGVREKGENPEPPQVLYNIQKYPTESDDNSNFERFCKVDSKQEATHWYIQNGECIIGNFDNVIPTEYDEMSYYKYDRS